MNMVKSAQKKEIKYSKKGILIQQNPFTLTRINRLKFILFFILPVSLLAQIQPSESHPLRLIYKFSNYSLPGGSEIYLSIPTHFEAKPIDFVFVTHKQDPKQELECRSQSDGVKMIDCLPGYTSFEVKDQNSVSASEDWRFWGGSGSGPFNSKFAEVRSGRGETDNLYEWRKKGHISVVTNRKSNAPLVPSDMRIRSVGKDSIILQEVVVKFLPPTPSDYDDVIFATGFEFGDFSTTIGRKYPGNPSAGNYGSSLSLNRKMTPQHRNIPNHWKVERGELLIPLKEFFLWTLP